MVWGALARLVSRVAPKAAPRVAEILPRVTAAPRVVLGAAERVLPRAVAAPKAAAGEVARGFGELLQGMGAMGFKAPLIRGGWKPAAAILGASGLTGILGWEYLKSQVSPPKYGDVPPVPGTIPPGTPAGDTSGLGAKDTSWLGTIGGYLSDPRLQTILGLTGVGAAGYLGYKAVKKLTKKKKAKVKKAKAKVKKPRPGTKRWMAYIRTKRGKGKKRARKVGVHRKLVEKYGTTPGMKRQQKLMKAGAKAWKRGRKLGTTYRAHIKQYLQRG